MDIVVILFLTSGLFLGWSLGANDAANVFGTAVGTRMVRFTTAALVCSIFVVLGAVFSGAGAANTLGTLGSVNALAGSFVAALSAALTVYLMTRLGLPVSTSQAIVGAIIGWNLFSGSITDSNTLFKILGTWVACPLLAGIIAAPLYKFTQRVLGWAQFHLLRLDAYTRAALIFAGAFGSYSLGANNIANVMGVFVEVSPFTDFDIGGMVTFTGIQQLFLIGAIAIGVGVFTYSKKVMLTVGTSLVPLSPVAAWVVVIAHSIVLFLFASEGLEYLLASSGLPTIPLVPVSSSQAVVGAVVGIGILKGGKNIDWKILGNIGAGWITTPIISAVVCFVALFFLQNVFNQQVYREANYSLSSTAMEHLVEKGFPVEDLKEIQGKTFKNASVFRAAILERTSLSESQEAMVLRFGEIFYTRITPTKLAKIDREWLGERRSVVLEGLTGRSFMYKWQLAELLARKNTQWKLLEQTTVNKVYNKQIKSRLDYLYRTFSDVEQPR